MRRTLPVSRLNGIDPARGLTAAEAERRLRAYGPNTIIEAARSGWLDIARDTLADPMVWFLIGTASLYAFLGSYAEASVLAAALLPIAGMDAYLHQRTQASTASLSSRLATAAIVVRDGARVEIPARDLAPGDIAIVAESTSFPADGLIVAGDNLQVDESALTGESLPVRKKIFDAAIPADGELSVDAAHWGSAGTRLLTGEATLRVVYTGADTLYGRIVRSVQKGRHERTPLQQAIGSLVRFLLIIAALLCLALAAIRYAQGNGVVDAVISAVTLAVAAIPEEFPVVFTFFLGVGVYRLAKRQALVRRAVVVENIGRISAICTDKTGTLTEGRLRLAHLLPAPGVDDAALLATAALAARAESKDLIDTLLLAEAAPKRGERLAIFPFTEDRRRETAIIQNENSIIAAMKGAPETVIAMTRAKEEESNEWLEKVHSFAASGHKVIACAVRRLDVWREDEPTSDYDFLGLIAFEDAVREGVHGAVRDAQDAGIRILMVTGDHPATAKAIAREVGIGGAAARVIEGPRLAELLEKGDANALHGVDVVARALPAQKLDLVRALQDEGEIVAVTGDGVNDVPALKGADIGIAMGERGAESAREVASIVLLDDNFRTIVRAIAEGRQLFLNLKLSFAYLLMVHAPLVATAALIPLAGFPLLYLPAHIVWLELIIHPTALLVFQGSPSSGRLAPVARRRKFSFFSRREWAGIALVGAGLTALIAFGYAYSLGPRLDVAHARSMSLVALIAGSAMATAVLTGFRTRNAVAVAAASLGSALLFVQTPAIATLLHLSPLHFDDWLIASLGGAVVSVFAVLARRVR